jgi:hypothetical protein
MSTRHALAHRHDPTFAATGDPGEAHMTWLRTADLDAEVERMLRWTACG